MLKSSSLGTLLCSLRRQSVGLLQPHNWCPHHGCVLCVRWWCQCVRSRCGIRVSPKHAQRVGCHEQYGESADTASRKPHGKNVQLHSNLFCAVQRTNPPRPMVASTMLYDGYNHCTCLLMSHISACVLTLMFCFVTQHMCAVHLARGKSLHDSFIHIV